METNNEFIEIFSSRRKDVVPVSDIRGVTYNYHGGSSSNVEYWVNFFVGSIKVSKECFDEVKEILLNRKKATEQEKSLTKEILMNEFQRGRECERRSIVARLKNQFIYNECDEYTCGYLSTKENYEHVTLEDICNFILEGDK